MMCIKVRISLCCLHSLFDSIHLDLNNEINKLRFPKNKKTKKPLIGTFLKQNMQ